MSKFSDLMKRIEQRSATVHVIGLGYIGLPTALHYASQGLKVHGLDTNKDLVSGLRNGIIRMKEEGLKDLADGHLSDITIEDSYENLGDSDVCVLCVPSPIDEERRPVMRYLEDSVAELGRRLKKGSLVIVESTVPVGTTDRLSDLFGSQNGLKLDKDYWFAHCPERVLPGYVVTEMGSNHRLAGGVSEMSTELATAFLSSVFGQELVHPSTARVAETAKLAENAFRDVNVAFANELAKVCKSLGIDVNDVIALANLHPRVGILRPGIGVGGYCIPKDGWFLVESVRGDLIQPKLIPAAREVNDSMPAHVFEIIREMGLEGHSLKSEVGLIGLSFKPNVSDTRNSPSVELVRLLISAGMDIIVYDPYTERDFGAKRAESLESLINACHVVILSVGHDEVVEELHNLDLSEKVLLDPGNSAPELKSRVRRYIGLSA